MALERLGRGGLQFESALRPVFHRAARRRSPPQRDSLPKIATGFNRNHPSSDEGGAIAEELRVSYVADRVKTTANVWLGLSMECAQCHDHKYDPISQKEYYQFYAYFNNTSDPGMQTRKGNHMPMVEVVSRADESALKQIDETLSRSKKQADEERNRALAGLVKWTMGKDGAKTLAKDTEAQFKNLKHYFPLDESEGNLLIDVRAQKDAVSKTPLKSVPGKHGSAIALDGKTAYLVPGFTEYDHRSKLTLSAWVKVDSRFTGAILSKMDNSKNYRGYDFWIEQGRPVCTSSTIGRRTPSRSSPTRRFRSTSGSTSP